MTVLSKGIMVTLLAGVTVLFCAARGAEGQVYSSSVTTGVKGFSGGSASLGSSALSNFRNNSTGISGQNRTSSSGLLWVGSGVSRYSPSGIPEAKPRAKGKRVERKVGSVRRNMRVSGAKRTGSGSWRNKIISGETRVANYGGGVGGVSTYGGGVGGVSTYGGVTGQAGYAGRLGQQRRSSLTSKNSLRSSQTLNDQSGRSSMKSLRKQRR